jgi:AGZA family xanthine/uracil permease-like MFS transporter
VTPYRWARWGDLNAFFGLMLDNVAVMGILLMAITTTLSPAEQLTRGQFGFTSEFVLTRMIPGTALGVLVGDLIYTWMAFRLAQRTGRDDVTAMPLGLDTPSTFGIAFLVLMPALRIGWDRFADLPVEQRSQQAMEFAWHVGLATLVISGLFKALLAPLGNAVRRLIPRAGLLGSLAAIALALIAFMPMLIDGIAGAPLVGMLALLVILVTLVAHRDLPYKFPGALGAVLLGLGIFLLGESTGLRVAPPVEGGSFQLAFDPAAMFSFYQVSTPGWWSGVLETTFNRLPVALPFALATVIGGIDCTESAAAAGDEYDTRAILFTEAIASLLAGLLGGVIQTTPYIGQPAYKKMGGRAAYTLITALFVGSVGFFGGFVFIKWLPAAALFPILVFVGLEITAQSFHATPHRHYPALAFSIVPALATLSLLVLKSVAGPFFAPTGERELFILQTLRCMSNGFLITGMLWSAALAMMLDGRMRSAAIYFAVAALCAFFGIIHSPLPDEQIGLPWEILRTVPEAFTRAIQTQTPYHWTLTYLIMAGLLVLLGDRPREEEGTAKSDTEFTA